MISDTDKSELGGLVLQALDIIAEEYGDKGSLSAACIVFEVKGVDDDGDECWTTHYRSLDRNSPNHVGCVLQGAAVAHLDPLGGVPPEPLQGA